MEFIDTSIYYVLGLISVSYKSLVLQVRAMECIRQLLLRSAEALFLLQLVSQHHVTRLVQGFDANLRQALVKLTFHQLVCSEEGDRLATRLISALMEVIESYIKYHRRSSVNELFYSSLLEF